VAADLFLTLARAAIFVGMPDANILVVAVDGLRAAALGAYGNTTFPTPALDQFAAESLLFDWCFAASAELTAIYGSLWQNGRPLLESLAERGYATTLVTDDAQVAALQAAGAFHDCVELPAEAPARAEDVSRTALAHLFAAASEQLAATPKQPRLVWVHARGMYGPWDAPLELQDELLAREEGDPPPAEVVEPPNLRLDDTSDPDTAFRWSCAYAAQVMTLDACLAGLCQTLDEAGRDRWLAVLAGVRSFPLGERGEIGGVDDRLYAEQLHVPLLWRLPDGRDRLARRGELVSLADVGPALASYAGGRWELPARRAFIASASAGRRAIRTADWSLHAEPTTDENGRDDWRCQLFVRPDDRWEANDVASLCPDEVQELLAELQAAAAAGGPRS
jgi:Sulfatase